MAYRYCVPESSSESEGSNSGDDYDHAAFVRQILSGPILPYQFEPLRSDYKEGEDEDDEGDEDSEGEEEEGAEGGTVPVADRLNVDVKAWCSCEGCSVMETCKECVCCREWYLAKKKAKQDDHEGCITNHPGFKTVCLDVHVVQTAYFAYRQEHGHFKAPIHERYRYAAYRQLVHFCDGYLGKRIHLVLPACAVSKIIKAFPSTESEFKYPKLD